MTYIVYARKYRPQTFDDVVGQDHITTTLKNAIQANRSAHAYIFAGPRGVGKTTTARILAKALNCEKSPRPEPCNKCAACLEITQGSNIDILEIDGASNRGIDEVRSLRENVKFSPSKCKFKVYIIDEVHMLTPEAFNALLKTLEEPPPHVKFIFATTQAHKVPPTILSRCQRFDFRRIPSAKIVESLKKISKEEKLKITDDALEAISKHADGSMRDAEVMLDQIASFRDGKIESGDVANMIGAVSEDSLFELSGLIVSRDAAGAMRTLDAFIDRGKDPSQVLAGLLEHFRNLMLAKISKDPARLMGFSPERAGRFSKACEGLTIEEILYAVYTFAGSSDIMRRTAFPRIPLEASIVKLCLRSNVIPLDEILKRLEGLEGSIGAPATNNPADTRVAVSPGPNPRPSEIPDASVSPEPPAAAASGITVDSVIAGWQDVLNSLRSKKMSVASYMIEGRPVSVDGDTVVIDFPRQFSFHKEALEHNPDNRVLLEASVKEVFGSGCKVKFTLSDDASNGKEASSPSSDEGSFKKMMPEASGRNFRKMDNIVEEALGVFDGEVVAREKRSPKDKMKG